ncbi:hypothetical protein MIR68_002345 [Amoeboaphelidium protococcarum]|nr:hypothetical protein MIR68_002345 [Amoeboaphelidium protococcarum]
MQLRNYQLQCIEESLAALRRGIKRQIVSLPVAAGKTVIFSNLIPQIPSPTPSAVKTLVLAHRQELISQAYTQIRKFAPHLRVDIDIGNRKANVLDSDAIVASVQSLSRSRTSRIQKYSPQDFKAILIDEAHHATASTYMRIFDHFGALQEDSHLFLWGCSATVQRHDAISLGKVFQEIVYHKDLREMIQDGWLCDINVQSVKAEVDLEQSLAKIKMVAEDYDLTELSRLVNTKERNQAVVQSWKQVSSEKQLKSTIVFAVDVAHCLALQQQFQLCNVPCRVITAKTHNVERFQSIQQFKAGETPVLINCAILTEGTDIPNIDCIVMARPTKSATLFQQMVGRGMRLHASKQVCTVLDFVDNCTRNKAYTSPSLLGLHSDTEDGVDVDCERQQVVSTSDANDIKQELADQLTLLKQVKVGDEWKLFSANNQSHNQRGLLSAMNNLAWIQVESEKYVLNMLDGSMIVIEKTAATSMYEAIKFCKDKTTKAQYQIRLPIHKNKLHFVLKAVDTYLKNDKRSQYRQLQQDAQWRCATPSDNQLKYAIKLGLKKLFDNRLNSHNLDQTFDEFASSLTKGQLQVLITLLRFGVGKSIHSSLRRLKLDRPDQSLDQRLNIANSKSVNVQQIEQFICNIFKLILKSYTILKRFELRASNIHHSIM